MPPTASRPPSLGGYGFPVSQPRLDRNSAPPAGENRTGRAFGIQTALQGTRKTGGQSCREALRWGRVDLPASLRIESAAGGKYEASTTRSGTDSTAKSAVETVTCSCESLDHRRRRSCELAIDRTPIDETSAVEEYLRLMTTHGMFAVAMAVLKFVYAVVASVMNELARVRPSELTCDSASGP